MMMFHIRINTGDRDITRVYHFVHKDWEHATEDEQKEAFDKAVKEINHIYQNYGRFATSAAVVSLFDKFGFERTIP